MKIDIYWDLRCTDPIRYTGVGKHVIEILNGLLKSGLHDVRVLLAKDQLDLWNLQASAFGWSQLATKVLPFSNKAGRLFFGITRLYSIDRICGGRDVVYSPMEMLLGLKRIPFVNTIHGLPCFEKSVPESIYKSTIYRIERLKQRWFLWRARQLCRQSCVVSDYLKSRLVEQFGFDEGNLFSVFNGADERFFAAGNLRKAESSGDQVLLSVGGINAFDGAERIVKIAKVLFEKMPEVKIRIAGDRHEEPWYSELRLLPNVRFLGFVQPEDLVLEMRSATALLYVPAVESFGIIGVEAMAIGLPILAQTSPPLDEVLGNACVRIDADHPETYLTPLKSLVMDVGFQQRLVDRGRLNSSRFRWLEVSEAVSQALKKAV